MPPHLDFSDSGQVFSGRSTGELLRMYLVLKVSVEQQHYCSVHDLTAAVWTRACAMQSSSYMPKWVLTCCPVLQACSVDTLVKNAGEMGSCSFLGCL